MTAKPITGWEDYYEITDNLDIVNKLTGKILKPYKNSQGYMVVTLCVNQIKKIVSMHRLVAEAFIPNPENKPEVNHINNNRQDYSIANLEWCTHYENMLHAFDQGRMESFSRKGVPFMSKSKWVLDLRTGVYYQNMKEAATARNINAGSVRSRIAKGDFKHDLIYVSENTRL